MASLSYTSSLIRHKLLLQIQVLEILILWETMRQRRVKIFIMLFVLMHIRIVLIRRRQCRIVQVRQPSWYDPIARSQSLSNIFTSDRECIDQLQMDRCCFRVLCSLVREFGGLRDTRNMKVEEMVAMFLNIVGHDL
uniref:DUF8040 domain-containing protein n=1 Tax=Setaria viridis TaxID=4556 RepID=A0A4U6SYL2_SETVI|nr:hypothetical protein SEVIR_9G274300v2 [Setaria viridis]